MKQTLKFEFTAEQIQIIGQALGNAPYNAAAPVLNAIQEQINAQQAPAAAASVDAAEPTR